mmetsp:Transcript_6981/g.15541  ORF Transcript_6981/g.15541 Transcript_6981/m.15541 type:complete len:210 (+) Transcript_6981:1226-1855(+)
MSSADCVDESSSPVSERTLPPPDPVARLSKNSTLSLGVSGAPATSDVLWFERSSAARASNGYHCCAASASCFKLTNCPSPRCALDAQCKTSSILPSGVFAGAKTLPITAWHACSCVGIADASHDVSSNTSKSFSKCSERMYCADGVVAHTDFSPSRGSEFMCSSHWKSAFEASYMGAAVPGPKRRNACSELSPRKYVVGGLNPLACVDA